MIEFLNFNEGISSPFFWQIIEIKSNWSEWTWLASGLLLDTFLKYLLFFFNIYSAVTLSSIFT